MGEIWTMAGVLLLGVAIGVVCGYAVGFYEGRSRGREDRDPYEIDYERG